MAPITASVQVACPPETVFSYVTDPSRFGEWQENVTGGHTDGTGPHRVGAICHTTRRMGFVQRAVTSEITHVHPPGTWGVRGIDGPIRARVDVTVRALDDPHRSELTISIDFEGHGIGKLLVPLVIRREAAKEMPRNLKRLKGNLESDAPHWTPNDESGRRDDVRAANSRIGIDAGEQGAAHRAGA